MSFKSSCSSRKFPSVRVACNRFVGIMSGPCVDVWKSAFPSPQHEVLPAPGRSTRDDIMIIHPLTSVSMPTAGPRPRPRDTVHPTSSGTPQSHHAAGEDPPRNPRLHRRTPSGSPWPMHGLLDQGRTWIQDTDTRIPGGRCNGTPPGGLACFAPSRRQGLALTCCGRDCGLAKLAFIQPIPCGGPVSDAHRLQRTLGGR